MHANRNYQANFISLSPNNFSHEFAKFGHFIVALRISFPTRVLMHVSRNFAAHFLSISLNNFSVVASQICEVRSFYCCVEKILFDADFSMHVTRKFTVHFISLSPNNFSDAA